MKIYGPSLNLGADSRFAASTVRRTLVGCARSTTCTCGLGRVSVQLIGSFHFHNVATCSYNPTHFATFQSSAAVSPSRLFSSPIGEGGRSMKSNGQPVLVENSLAK